MGLLLINLVVMAEMVLKTIIVLDQTSTTEAVGEGHNLTHLLQALELRELVDWAVAEPLVGK